MTPRASRRLMLIAVLLLTSLVLAEAVAAGGEDPALEYAWQQGFEYHCAFQATSERSSSSQGYSGLTVYTPVADDPATLAPGEEASCSGTAFAITRDGHLVTCAHVVHRATKITAHFGAKSYAAEVVAYDADCDLAIVKVDAEDLACLGFFDSDKVQLAQDVRVVGYPLSDVLGESIKMSRGTIAGIIHREDENRFQIDAQVNPGNSGGPLVDEQGRVVGIASELLAGEAIDSVGFAIPGNEAMRLAREQGLAVELPPDGGKPEGPELASRVTPAVALLKVETGPGGYADRKAQVLKYSAVYSEDGRFGGAASYESGRLAVDPGGEIRFFEGQRTVPLVVQPIGAIGIERLPDKGKTAWKSTRFLFLRTSVAVSSRPEDMFSPLYPRLTPPRVPLPYGRHSPLAPFDPLDRLRPRSEESHVETRILPAIEEVAYQCGSAAADGGLSVSKTYTLETLGDDESDAKALALKITGTLTWDPQIRAFTMAQMKGQFARTDDNVTVRVPVELTYQMTRKEPRPATPSATVAGGSTAPASPPIRKVDPPAATAANPTALEQVPSSTGLDKFNPND